MGFYVQAQHENDEASQLGDGWFNVNNDDEMENMLKSTYMENLLLSNHEGKWRLH